MVHDLYLRRLGQIHPETRQEWPQGTGEMWAAPSITALEVRWAPGGAAARSPSCGTSAPTLLPQLCVLMAAPTWTASCEAQAEIPCGKATTEPHELSHGGRAVPNPPNQCTHWHTIPAWGVTAHDSGTEPLQNTHRERPRCRAIGAGLSPLSPLRRTPTQTKSGRWSIPKGL